MLNKTKQLLPNHKAASCVNTRARYTITDYVMNSLGQVFFFSFCQYFMSTLQVKSNPGVLLLENNFQPSDLVMNKNCLKPAQSCNNRASLMLLSTDHTKQNSMTAQTLLVSHQINSFDAGYIFLIQSVSAVRLIITVALLISV